MTFKKTESGSYVVGLVGELIDANAYITDCYRERVEFTGAAEAVREMSRQHPAVAAKLIENKANGPAVIDTLSDNISGIIAVETDGSKEARAASSTARVEAGNWHLPHPDIAPWVSAFIDELAAFPTGRHNDQVDAFSQLDRYLYSAGDYSELDAYYDRQLGRR
jgi:predicted phage terminase large subunit-like protein